MSFRPIWARRLWRSPLWRLLHTTTKQQQGSSSSSSSSSDPPAAAGFFSSPRARAIGRFGFYMFSFAMWLPPLLMFNEHVLETTRISGPSMYPFLNAERDQTRRRDIVLNYKYGAQDGLQRGMIVTFWSPWNPELVVVKRIIGLEGDVVRTRESFPVSTVRVPPGHVWVEGDGGERESWDSNAFGPIATALIIGKVTHILWPLHRAGRVPWEQHAEQFRKHI